MEKKKSKSLVEGLKNVGYQGAFVVCDTESTGFYPNDTYSKLLQISAVKTKLYEKGSSLEQFDELVNPELPFLKPRKSHPDEKRRGSVPKKITELTGITNDMVTDKPGWRTVLPDFYNFIGDKAVMVYHNATHDVDFMHYFGSKIGLDFRSMPVIDTMVLAKYLWPDEPKRGGYKLETLAKKFEIDDPQHHNSLNDAMVTLELLKIEIKELARRGELKKCDWDHVVDMHDDRIDLKVTGIKTWMTPDRTKKRIYVNLMHQEGSQYEYAHVYYDFGDKLWGQKQNKTDIKVRNFAPVQKDVMRILNVSQMNWTSVYEAVNDIHS